MLREDCTGKNMAAPLLNKYVCSEILLAVVTNFAPINCLIEANKPFKQFIGAKILLLRVINL